MSLASQSLDTRARKFSRDLCVPCRVVRGSQVFVLSESLVSLVKGSNENSDFMTCVVLPWRLTPLALSHKCKRHLLVPAARGIIVSSFRLPLLLLLLPSLLPTTTTITYHYYLTLLPYHDYLPPRLPTTTESYVVFNAVTTTTTTTTHTHTHTHTVAN